jgi:hypothetical protein
MAVTTDIWRTFNSILDSCSDWIDAIRGASLRLLFPALDVRHSFFDIPSGVSTQILGERKGARRFTIIQNISDTDMFVSLDGNSAVVNQGIRISANGNLLLDITLVGTSISAIHSGTGNKRITISEDVQ